MYPSDMTVLRASERWYINRRSTDGKKVLLSRENEYKNEYAERWATDKSGVFKIIVGKLSAPTEASQQIILK